MFYKPVLALLIAIFILVLPLPIAAQALPTNCEVITNENAGWLSPVTHIVHNGIHNLHWYDRLITLIGIDQILLLDPNDLHVMNTIERQLGNTAIHPSQTELAISGRGLTVMDFITGEVVANYLTIDPEAVLAALLQPAGSPESRVISSVTGLSYSPSGDWLAASLLIGAGDSSINIWDTETGEMFYELPFDDYLLPPIFVNNGENLLTATHDELLLLDTTQPQILDQQSPPTRLPDEAYIVDMDLSSAGDVVAVLTSGLSRLDTSSVSVAFLDPHTFQQVGGGRAFTYAINSTEIRERIVYDEPLVEFNANDTVLALTNGRFVELWEFRNNSVIERIRSLGEHETNVIDMAFSPDGHFLATLNRPRLENTSESEEPATITIWGICS